MTVNVFGEDFSLLPEKALLWKAKRMLLLADLHLGKINHFRRSGIPVPTKANSKNWGDLIHLVQSTKPERVVFLGDLFHSHYNEEWEVLGQVVKNFPGVSFELVVGNHDILSDVQYVRNKIHLHRDVLVEDSFSFTHYPLEEATPGVYNLSGHVHPGVQLLGKGKQALTLPCFYFGKDQGILPAFGSFTGLAHIRPRKDDRVFVIVEDQIMLM